MFPFYLDQRHRDPINNGPAMNKGGNRAGDTLGAVARIRKDSGAIRRSLLKQVLKIKILLCTPINLI